MTNGVHWMELVIVAFFVGLRLYTRKAILNSVGLDDYITVLALVRIPTLPVSSVQNLTNPDSPTSLHLLHRHIKPLRSRTKSRRSR